MSSPSRSLPLTAILLLLSACKGCKEEDGEDDTGPEEIHITPHCGDITGEETWSASDNRHLLTCDVTVTGTLTLGPGAEVYFEPGTTLWVNGGTLTASGDQHEPILLESNAEEPAAGDHGGIVGTDATVTVDWVTLRHGGAQGALLQLTGGTAGVSYSTFANGITYGIVGDGTDFKDLDTLNIAYVPNGLMLPWNAPAVLTNIYYDQVGTQSIILPDDVISETAVLPANDYVYVHDGPLTVEKAAELKLEPGALLQMGGDITVHGGIEVFGSYEATARMEGVDHEPFAIDIQSTAFSATFYYARILDATIVSASQELKAMSSTFLDAQGDVLTIVEQGGVMDGRSTNLASNTLSGTGYGLVVAPSVLGSVGRNNDLAGSLFNGVAIQGGTISEDTDIIDLPTDQFMVLGTVRVDGADLIFNGGTFFFADDTALDVEDGALQVSGATFVHAGSTPGGWYGVTLGPGSDASFLDNTEIGWGGSAGGANVMIASDATIRTCYIHDSAGWGVYLEAGASPEFEDNTYSNNAYGDVGP